MILACASGVALAGLGLVAWLGNDVRRMRRWLKRNINFGGA